MTMKPSLGFFEPVETKFYLDLPPEEGRVASPSHTEARVRMVEVGLQYLDPENICVFRTSSECQG